MISCFAERTGPLVAFPAAAMVRILRRWCHRVNRSRSLRDHRVEHVAHVLVVEGGELRLDPTFEIG